ncbi:sensor histidine kinase [Urechidicola vernalis]|uniref:Histidine kinase n=1 Tax=Urechidicola vernalis TaxID=3075600 RepID=A0ABU2Y5X2_9FLAO|nr:histidine kinase [Urechidicola sp. P050]MDT0553608.1 histidine kinase [Urechidicola sp. P050]
MFVDIHSEIYSWIRGGLFVLVIYHLLIYFQNRRTTYLYYSLYLLGLFIYFYQHVFDNIVSEGIYEYINFPIQFLAYACFALFTRNLLETRIHNVQWDKFLELEVKVLLALAPMFIFIEMFLGYEFQLQSFTIVGPLLTIFNLTSFYYLYKIPGITSKYFVFGSLLYVVLANISFLQLFVDEEVFANYGVHPMFFMYIGAFIQSIVFASTLGHSVKRIEQRSKNAEVKLAIKQKQMEELKMTALQSQMNPHFLFNSLNSINNFVLKNDVEKASDYITKFSRLIRVILKSSSSLTIPLSEELGILGLYVKLEQMRIKGGFEYIINVDNGINLEEVKVPPLFLQPYLENSIWHGIMHVEGDKRVELTIRKEENSIRCEVVDNGIGIDNSKRQPHKQINRRKFFGTQATENRIKLLHRQANVVVDISDISTEEKTGTKVTIVFPISS